MIRIDILGQSSVLVAVTSFALAFSVLARNVRNKLFISFAILCALICLWEVFFFLDKIWPESGVYYWLHLLINIWLAPTGLLFIRIMMRVRDRFSQLLLNICFIFAFLLSGALMLGLNQVPLIKQWIFFAPAPIVIQILRLLWTDKKVLQAIEVGRSNLQFSWKTVALEKRTLIYLGCIVVLSTSVLDHVPMLGDVIPVIGNLLLAVYLFFLSQAITQQRLLNFGELFSRFLVLLAVSLILTAVYALMVAWIEDSPGLFFLNSFIASFFVLMLLDPLRTTMRFLTIRLLTQKHRSLQEILRESQRKLTGVMGLESLFETIFIVMEQTLGPDSGALFILKNDGTKYQHVKTYHAPWLNEQEEPSESAILKEVLVDHKLLRYCRELHKKGDLPILLDQNLENEVERSASRTQKAMLTGLIQAMKALGGNLLIPLFDTDQSTDQILGFVVLAIPAPPEPWGNNWGLLQIIYPYFEQAAQTLRNTEVYVRQREIERLAALGEMAAGLAHEIRNPLGAIKGAAQFLDPSAARPESKFLGIILEEVDRLNRVVTQFLDYSKPFSATYERVDLNELVRKTIDFLRPTIPQNVSLTVDIGPGALVVRAAPGQIQQVLLNLVQNSIKALEKSSDAKVQVTVSVSGRRNAKNALIVVEDNGPGISRQNMEKIFIPFFTTSPSGTGLGLSICQKIIEAHQGRIEVQSEEKRFTRFQVILPSLPENDMAVPR